MNYVPLVVLAEAELNNEMDGDVLSEIGLFTLYNVPSTHMDRVKMSISANNSEWVKDNYDVMLPSDLEPFAGWSILQEWEEGAGGITENRFHLSRYDTAEEASEAFTAMQETYFAEIGE